MKDSLVPYKHSESLYEEISVPTELYMPKMMTHGVFDFSRELTDPLNNFLDKVHFNLNITNFYTIPKCLYTKPESFEKL